MNKRVIICDEEWYNENSNLLKETGYDELIKISFKGDFSYKILNEIQKRTSDTICIVGKNSKRVSDINKALKFSHNRNNTGVVTINRPNNFDFSLLSQNGTVVCFPSKIFTTSPDSQKISTILDLQKYFLSILFTKYYYLYMINSRNKFKKVEVDEDKFIKNARKKKPSKPSDSEKQKDETPKNVIDSKPPSKINENPKVLIVCDVKGWAWWIKSQYIKKYLSDEFDIDIINMIGSDKKQINFNKYDLFFTYGHSYIKKIMKAPFNRRITGVTAHRSTNVIENNMKKAYATHANSILLLNELKQIHNNCYYLPNGVDTDLFYPKKESNILERDHINIGHIGKLSKMKRQKEILEPAIEQLKKRGNKIHYISHYNNYKNKIPYNQMPDIYQNIDILLIASQEDGTPASLIDGASCGIPTIGNRIGNLPEFITQNVNGYIVGSPTINNFVQAIESFSKEHLVEMGRNARKTAKEWDWKIQAENYRALFKDLLQMDK